MIGEDRMIGEVLIVDDNEQNCEILEDVISIWGYKTYKAFQGMEAYDMACKHKPEIILLDVMLPGMNGFEVCKKLKKNKDTKNIPIVMLTALNDVEDRIRGFDVGADEFLSKPINYQELRNRVTSLIMNKNQLEKMENSSQIVESYLKILKAKDDKLYSHACMVKNYSSNVAKIMAISDLKREQLIIGAYLHDLGKISDASQSHVEVGEDIIAPLKMSKWLSIFIRNHHEKLNGQGFPDGLKEPQMSIELQILVTINRFVELWEQSGDKGKCIDFLFNESEKGYWSIAVIEALKQVYEDEKFIANFKYKK